MSLRPVAAARAQGEKNFAGACLWLAPPAAASGPINCREDFRNAKERIETEDEVEDPPRRPEALQVHGQRQDQARALRQTALDGHESSRPDAQAEKADAGEQSGRGQRQADASLRLDRNGFSVRAVKPHAF